MLNELSAGLLIVLHSVFFQTFFYSQFMIPEPLLSMQLSLSRPATATATHTVHPAISPKTYQRTIFLGLLEGDKLVQDKALVIPLEESEACLSTMKITVKDALALGPEESIVLTDNQGHVLPNTPDMKGSAYWKESSKQMFVITEDVFAEMERRKRRKLGGEKKVIQV